MKKDGVGNKDLGFLTDEISFKSKYTIRGIHLSPSAKGAKIKLTIPSQNWNKIYDISSLKLEKRDQFGLRFHLDGYPYNKKHDIWEYIISLEKTTKESEKINVKYAFSRPIKVPLIK